MSGIVHVGAHRGEEIAGYLAEGKVPVICFEPLWEKEQEPGVLWVHSALSDVSGSLVMRVPRHLTEEEGFDTQSASGLDLIPERAVEIGWTPTGRHCISCTAVRFDEWASENGYHPELCSHLVIDVQGMELQVLKGFGDYILGFNSLKIECSSPPLYKGGASAEEVIEYLRWFGFLPTSGTLQHGDITFERIYKDVSDFLPRINHL